MTRLNHRQVEAFRAVVLTGSMTGAAELLRISQPAVSRLVRDFEHATGLALFERKGNGVLPTPDAMLILAEVERSFVGLNRIAETAQAIRVQETGWLRIAAMPTLAASVLPRFIGRFLRDRPTMRVSIQEKPSHLVYEAIAAGQAEIGYAVGSGERPGFVVEPLPSRAVAILPAGHRLASREIIVPKDFSGERFISVGSGTLFQSRVLTTMAGVDLSCTLEAAWTQTACLLVAEGAGLSIVDPGAASEFEGRGIVLRRFEPAIDNGFVSLRLPHRPISALGETVMRAIADQIAAFGERPFGGLPAS